MATLEFGCRNDHINIPAYELFSLSFTLRADSLTGQAHLLVILNNTNSFQMAEVIGISSGVAALLSLALKSSNTLLSTVKSLRNRERAIRDLREVLRDLEDVLKILQDSISTSSFLNSGIIERPLDRCYKACNDFNALILECSEHSTDNHFSIRDWAKLRYMGEDVTGFQNMLSGYKSTITIALAYSNVLVHSISLQGLSDFLKPSYQNYEECYARV